MTKFKLAPVEPSDVVRDLFRVIYHLIDKHGYVSYSSIEEKDNDPDIILARETLNKHIDKLNLPEYEVVGFNTFKKEFNDIGGISINRRVNEAYYAGYDKALEILKENGFKIIKEINDLDTKTD